jgi:hypothetical protein
MAALAMTMELLDSFRSEMQREELNPNDVEAGLVFFQPKIKEILAHTVIVPPPGEFGRFCEEILALEGAVFLGLLFLHRDAKAKKAGDEKRASVLFGYPFTKAHNAAARLLAAKDSQAKGGLKSQVVN